MENTKKFLKNNWLVCLIAMQPVLDVLAFFTRNSSMTPAGIIRLLIMFALPLYLLVTMEDKKRLILPMAVIALYCAAHIVNCFRTGYTSFTGDVRYMIGVMQMPVLAICFLFLIRNEETQEQTLRGIFIAAVLYALFQLLSVITDSYTPTYLLTGIGVSGWVIDSNRSANSIIVIILACFAVFYALSSGKKLLFWTVPPLAVLFLVINGTSACYLTAFGLPVAYVLYFLPEPAIRRTGFRWKAVVFLCAIIAVTAAAYPLAPNRKNDRADELAASKHQIRANLELDRTGVDMSGMSIDDMLKDEALREKVHKIYRISLNYNAPELLKEFGYDRVMEKYDYSIDTAYLCDTRRMKRVYAQLSFEDCDTATKLLGFETSRMDKGDHTLDLENDWHALFYYYGFIGFALYAAFLLYFVFLIVRALLRDFRGSYDPLNFTLMIVFVLQLGLAQFSGQLLRRPNASFYTSLTLALIYYRTVTAGKTVKGQKDEA